MKLTGILLATLLPKAFALWPMPRNLQSGTAFVKLSSNFDIHVNIKGAPLDLLAAVDQAKTFLKTDKLERLNVGRGANDSAAIGRAPSLSQLSISLADGHVARPIAQEAVQKITGRSEGYSLTIPGDGNAATLTANSTLGLFRGLTTFNQLWYDNDGTTYTFQAPVKIVNDIPAYVSVDSVQGSKLYQFL